MEVAGECCMPCGTAPKLVPLDADIVLQFAGELPIWNRLAATDEGKCGCDGWSGERAVKSKFVTVEAIPAGSLEPCLLLTCRPFAIHLPSICQTDIPPV